MIRVYDRLGRREHCLSINRTGFLLLERAVLQSPWEKASLTIAYWLIPEILGPLSPTISIRGPNKVQLSSQKLAVVPDPTSQTTNCLASTLREHKAFQTQLSLWAGTRDQKFWLPIRCILTHERFLLISFLGSDLWMRMTKMCSVWTYCHVLFCFFFLTKTYCHVALSFHESLYVKETGSLILEQMILNIYIYN